jgi:hypothetical protein
MKSILITLLLIPALFSFRNSSADEKSTPVSAAFGICSCQNTGGGAFKFEVRLNADYTFSYFDNSNPKKPVDIVGTYIRKGNRLFLKTEKQESGFHDKWKLDENDECIHSRKGMEWSRLCNLISCTQ